MKGGEGVKIKLRPLCVALCLALILCACSPLGFQNVEDLLRAPGMENAAQKALAAHLNEEPQYVFPKEGDWRSPLVTADLDGDNVPEAVLFYRLSGTSAQTGAGENVYMAVLSQQAGAWQVVYKKDLSSPDIASVAVTHLFRDGTAQLVVGCANANFTVKTLKLYQYAKDEWYAEQISYSKYMLGDFTGEGYTDLALVSPSDTSGGMQLSFINGRGNQFNLQSSLPLHPNFSSCENIVAGQGAEGERVLVVDGLIVSSATLASQIFIYSTETGSFYAPPDTTEILSATMRYSPFLHSRDIDGDGQIEIPVEDKNNIATPNNDKTLHYVSWKEFSGPEVEKQWGILDVTLAAFVRMPPAWAGRIAVEDGYARGEWRVVNAETGEELLQMRYYSDGVQGMARAVRGNPGWYVTQGADLPPEEWDEISVVWLL